MIPDYDPELQAIAAFAAETLGAPVALLSALGDDRQTFLAEVGFGRAETTLEESFCAHAVRGDGVFEVADATADPRFAANPLVTGPDRVRFYAGVPVASPDGVRHGALCVLGPEPRALDDAQRRTLAFLARQAEARLLLLDRERAAARTEADARRSAELLRLVTDRVPVRIAYLDHEYRFRFLNDAYLAQVGLLRERALGRTLVETLGEPMFLQAKPNLDRALAGEAHTQEFDALYNTGTRPIRATYVPDRDAAGRVVGVVVQVEDLTAQRTLERVADQERVNLDRTLDRAGVATYDWHIAEDRMFGNTLFATWFGVPNRPEGNPLTRYFEAIHPDDRERIGGLVQRALTSGERYEMRYRVRDAAGTERHLFARGEAALGADGRPERLFGVFLDETERVAAERMLAEERDRLDRTLGKAEVGTFEWDLSTDRVYVNPLAASFFGHPEAIANGGPVGAFFDRIHADDRDSLGKCIQDSMTNGRPYETHYRVRDGEGRERQVFTRGDTLFDAEGRPARVSGIVLDMTERVELDAARRATETRYQTLFDALEDGFCVIEMIRDAEGYAVDYRFREVNAAFEGQTGITADQVACGLTMRQIAPDHEAHWFETYDRVARTGEPVRFENAAAALGRYYEVTAFRLGREGSTEVGILFKDIGVRHATERALTEARARLDTTLEAADVATYDWDVPNDRLYGNALLARFFGIPNSPDGNPIAPYFGRLHPDDRAATETAIAHSLETGAYYETSYRVTGDDGRERSVFVRGETTLDAEGRALRLSGVVVDVTAQVAAQRAATEREELFRTVFEQAPDDAILVMDRDRTLTGWNPAAERITGWTAAEAIGQPADLIFSPESRAAGAPQDEIDGAARDGKAMDERWHMKRDGSRFWGSGTMNALHDADGNVTGFLKVFRDATARYEEARALAFLRRFTDAIVEVRDPDAIMSTTARMLGEHLGVGRVAFGTISEDGTTATVTRDWTDGLASVVGTYRVADFSPEIVWHLAAGRPHVSNDSERDYAPGRGLEAVRAIGSRASVTTPILKDGRLASYLLVHSAAPRSWTEEEIGLVKQVADRVTAEVERARAERALQAANDALEGRVVTRTAELAEAVQQAEGFNYSISHDLRTPLRAIVSTASILRDELGPELDEEHRELLERQVHNASRMGRLIDELLRLSRYARVEVRRLPLDMTAKARSVAEGEGCEIEVQEGMTATGDPELVRTVLQNLIGNACKFSPNGGTVRVAQSGEVFRVSDEGVGFDMAFAPKIFLPFERLVGDGEFEGTGIGLANVKRIVERHGGRVWAESAPGEGATFFFTLGPA